MREFIRMFQNKSAPGESERSKDFFNRGYEHCFHGRYTSMISSKDIETDSPSHAYMRGACSSRRNQETFDLLHHLLEDLGSRRTGIDADVWRFRFAEKVLIAGANL